MEETDSQHKRQDKAPWLKDYRWKPGQSGNLAGGPKGKTLKTWAREFLMELPDELKLDFLKNMPADIVWKMAEGNPETNVDHGGRVEIGISYEFNEINSTPVTDCEKPSEIQGS